MTRLAVFSDVHGNTDALAAVLQDLRGFSPDLVLNLGDVFSGPLDPAGTMALLADVTALTARGNHDRWLLDPLRCQLGWEALTRPQLDDRALGWLASLPGLLQVQDILACHGTPDSDTTYWMEEVSPTGEVQRADSLRLAAPAAGRDAQLFLCGHTHLPRVTALPDGRLVVNPGSVGLPGYQDDAPFPHRVCSGTPQASYMILDRRGQEWSVTHRLVAYDATRMIALARAAGASVWEEALATGWVPNPPA